MNKLDMTRRGFGAGAIAVSVAGFPAILRGQTQTVKLGLVHPVTGFLSFNGSQCRLGCQMAIEDINNAGGVRALGGAKIEAMVGDAQSKPEVGVAEVEKMAQAGVHAFSGCFSSSIGLAATQAAAKYNIPFSVDVGVSDRLTDRGLKNVFRLSDGFGRITQQAVENLDQINKAAGKPATSAVIVHEESEFGTGTAKLVGEALPKIGIEVKETVKHANPTRNFDNIALRIKQLKPSLVIMSNYQNEYALLARTLLQQKVPVTMFSVLGGGFNMKFVKELPDVSNYMMDVNHWYNPRHPAGIAMRKRVEATGNYFTFEIYLSYNSIKMLVDAIERAGSTDKEKMIAALESSSFSDHFMPYGPTKFVNGQNQSAKCLTLQALNGEIQVINPPEYAITQAVFPRPKA